MSTTRRSRLRGIKRGINVADATPAPSPRAPCARRGWHNVNARLSPTSRTVHGSRAARSLFPLIFWSAIRGEDLKTRQNVNVFAPACLRPMRGLLRFDSVRSHLRRIRQIRQFVDNRSLRTLVHAQEGREGECPSRFRCKGARIGLYPPAFRWLHSLWSDWNSVKTNESVCWSTQCLQIL